jgi:hypothetical protein
LTIVKHSVTLETEVGEMKWLGPDGWKVEHIVLDGPARADRRACLPAAPAEHFAVTLNGFLRARPGSVEELARALPFPLQELEAVAADQPA